MANHSRDDINKNSKEIETVEIKEGSITDIKEKYRINNRINKLKGEFLGSFTNSEEIERLEAERSNWEKQLRS